MTVYLPIMLDCSGQRCLVVGGGNVAQRKIDGLLEAGAEVVVISPALNQTLAELAASKRVNWHCREFAPGDTRGAFLIYAASNHSEVNREVAAEALTLGIPVNVASHAEEGSFITPGVVRRGRLTVAVSASGAGPGAVMAIRDLLDETLGEEYAPYLDFLHRMRTEIKKRESSPEIRSRLLGSLTSLNVLKEIREGTFIEWSQESVDTWIAQHREE
ncbi:bifunctional precorrin-2 dehydrogenase/sirohydrochlorin ferrochelatase [Paenibacillus sp. sgz500958]|uniref:precorrin-2 dehydrogenase/sirohydrochlorin ferrochelatase family protein n=1 Tax=Paenibacillus sp. sgz500958 TaxID=3242475 RepID=UPI0036D4036B